MYTIMGDDSIGYSVSREAYQMHPAIAHYLRICLSSLLLTCVLLAQGEPQDTPLPGMRGVPRNLPDVSLVGDINVEVTEDKNDIYRNKVHGERRPPSSSTSET